MSPDVKSCLDQLPEGLKLSIDAVSITALLGSLVSLLPSIASLLTIIWTAMRIYETALTVRQIKSKEKDNA